MIVTVPCASAVAKPVEEPMVAICGLLDVHATWLVKFSVAPEDVVPIAMNCVVRPGLETAWAAGIIDNAATFPPVFPTPLPVTVTVAVALIFPGNPIMLAVIVVVPGDIAVASPLALIVAIAGALDDQLTKLVTSSLEDGCCPCPTVPVAVNWTVCPTASVCDVGLI